MENEGKFGVHDEFTIKKENSKTDNGAMIPHLPQELIYEILLLLPINPLCRFKCVSKSFRAIIDSQDFMNRRLNTNKIHPKMIFPKKLTSPRMQKSKCTEFYVCDMDGNLEEEIRINKPGRNNLFPYSYCNGLFLLSDGTSKLVLWNPSTKQYRNLPACPVNGPNDDDYRPFRMGLGYDAAGDDYKVVLIDGVSYRFERYGHARPCEVWIFGLRSNAWRRIRDSLPFAQHYWSDFAYFSLGDLHWLCTPPISQTSRGKRVHLHEQKIVAFDVTKETFSEVMKPVYTIEGYLTGLNPLEGCLCVSFFSYTTPEEAYFHVRKKDGNGLTWSQFYSFTTAQMPRCIHISFFKFVRVVGYSKEKYKIILDFGVRCLVSYDMKKKIFDQVDIRGGYATSARAFRESVVSLGLGTTSTEMGVI